MTRRGFLRWLGGAGAVAVAGGLTHEALTERWAVRVWRYDLPVRGLPRALEGLRIVQMSDLHAGAYLPWWVVEKAVALAVAEAPDLLLLTGDYVSLPGDEGRSPLQHALAPLTAKYGVWAVLGNHEYVQGRKRPVMAALREAGAKVLLNSSERLEIQGEEIWVCGLEDPYSGHHDFEKTLAAVPEAAFTLLLAHSPDIIYSSAQLGLRAVFAGHTHGGQVALPVVGPLVVPSRYGRRFASGVFAVEGTALFVTRGVGMIRPLVRLGCPPEVAFLRLTRAP